MICKLGGKYSLLLKTLKHRTRRPARGQKMNEVSYFEIIKQKKMVVSFSYLQKIMVNK